MVGKPKITVARDAWSRGIGLRYGISCNAPNSWNIAQPLTFKVQSGLLIVEPFLELDPETAQELMDELWNVGLRPSSEYGSAGQLASIKYHLEDMRKLVFKE